MIYTTYLNKLNEIPQDAIKILATKWKGKIDLSKYNLDWKPELAPDELIAHRNGNITKQELIEKFKFQLEKEPSLSAIKELESYLNNNEDVYILCYCKDLCNCHRRIIAATLKENTNIDWEEYKGRNYYNDKN